LSFLDFQRQRLKICGRLRGWSIEPKQSSSLVLRMHASFERFTIARNYWGEAMGVWKKSLLTSLLCGVSFSAIAAVNIYGGSSSDVLNLPNNGNFGNWNRPLVVDAGRFLGLIPWELRRI
jgi:hypothetical protein